MLAEKSEKRPQGEATVCVAPIGAAGVRFGRALAAAQFSLVGAGEPRSAIAARVARACRTHAVRFFRPSALAEMPQSLQAIWQKD
jgi:hypothetical protein